MNRHEGRSLTALEKIFTWLLKSSDFKGKYFLMRVIRRFSNNDLYLKSHYDLFVKENFNDLTWRLNYFGYKDTTVYEEVNAIPEDACFIDIGANIGTFSMVAAKNLGDSGLVISFEPNPAVYSDLIKNISANNLATKLLPLNVAISEETMHGSLAYNPSHTGASHLSGNSSDGLRIFIAAWRDLQFVEKLIDERDIYIKVDVEGAEVAVLKSIEPLLRNENIKKIIVEIDDEYLERAGESKEAVYRFMDYLGFAPKFNYLKKHYDEIFQKKES